MSHVIRTFLNLLDSLLLLVGQWFNLIKEIPIHLHVKQYCTAINLLDNTSRRALYC